MSRKTASKPTLHQPCRFGIGNTSPWMSGSIVGVTLCFSKGMARKHAVWSQESPSSSSRLMAIRTLPALWLVYCYCHLRFESLSEPFLVRGYRQYGAVPQSATTFGCRCQVYPSSLTSTVRGHWAVLLPWYRNIHPSNEHLIVDYCYSKFIVSRIGFHSPG
jgi:hypothetical protein